MQWDEKELDTQFTPNLCFWTPNSEILAKALISWIGRILKSLLDRLCDDKPFMNCEHADCFHIICLICYDTNKKNVEAVSTI